jgi:L-tartrate/succinate antiporter
MGPLSRRELLMSALAVLALALWIFGGRWLNATTVALLSLCLMVVTGVVSWDDILGYRRAWNNLVWFATLITLADGLSRVGFLRWFATTMGSSLEGLSPSGKVVLIVAVFFVSHYMYYGSGYISHRDFWTLGLGFGALYLVAVLALELPYLALLYR